MENKTDYTYECVKVKESPLEIVNAARKAADKAEDKCNKMAMYVAEMQGWRDHYKSELKMSRGDEEKAEADANFVMYNRLLSDGHTKWTEALNSHQELWQKYSDLLEDYEEKERNAERPDEKCTFCGEMDCEGDHADEMRDIGRMEDKYWRRY